MKELLNNYTLSEIVIFVIFLIFAIKEFISIFDWFRERLTKIYDKRYHAKEEHEKLENEIEDLNKLHDEKKDIDKTFTKVEQAFERVNQQIEMLIESDKEDIKSFITSQHHHFVYDKGWIDDYSLECLEKRFAIYEREHGNSFVGGLMKEIRELPKHPPFDLEQKYIGTAKYIYTEYNKEE